jgi:hypothetical protein
LWCGAEAEQMEMGHIALYGAKDTYFNPTLVSTSRRNIFISRNESVATSGV